MMHASFHMSAAPLQIISQTRSEKHQNPQLVGGFKHLLLSIIYGIILPIDYYFSEGLKPPTNQQLMATAEVISYTKRMGAGMATER